MIKTSYREVRRSDLLFLAENLRAADVQEHIAAHGHTNVLKTLEASVQNSDEAWVGEWEGKPAAVWGITRVTPEIATIWCVGTPAIFKAKMTFVKDGRNILRSWFSQSPELQHLFNFVHAKNTRHIRWLSAMGAKILPPVQVGASSDGFHPFVIRRYPDV